MPYAENAGVRIHYQIEGSSGPALVLQHGLLQSIEDWYECGYVDALKTDFRLILVDARGHGASDKPHDPAEYPLEKRVGDVVAVLDATGNRKAHFWGYSAGGWIGFGIGQLAPDRVDRLVIGGQHPFARSYAAYRQFIQVGITDGPGAFVAAVEQMAGTPPPGWRRRLHEGDLEAYLAAAQDRTSLEAGLAKMAMPCCLYAGDADPVFAEQKSASELMPHANFFALPGLTHLQGFVRTDLVLPRVTTFLRGAA